MTLNEFIFKFSGDLGITRSSDGDILANHIANEYGISRQSQLTEATINRLLTRYGGHNEPVRSSKVSEQ